MTSESAPTALARHRLPVEHLRLLMTGRGSADITDLFWRSEWSRRRLELHAVRLDADRETELLGPLPPAGTAWDALSGAEHAAPDAVRTVLLHPQVGSWAAYTLRRRLRAVKSASPYWVDVGGLHTLALVASTAAGLSWRTSVPARAGQVMLPALGLASFAGVTGDAVAEAETSDGRIRMRLGDETVTVPEDATQDGPGWWGLRRVRVDADLPLTVWLDDLDPFRDLADPEPPARLDDAEFARWTRLLTDAWRLLLRDHREEAEAMTGGVVSLVPLSHEEGWGTRSASTGEAFGSIMVSPPPDPVTLAEVLVHEYQHITLGGLIHHLTLSTSDNRLYYAPWRYDPRPLGGFVQGVFAFLGIANFWRQHRWTAPEAERDLAAFQYARARAQTNAALRVLRAAVGLTADGHALVEGITERCTPWLDDEVPFQAARLAGLAIDSHRLCWQLRHQRPSDDDQVSRLAEAWPADATPSGTPAPEELHPDPEFLWQDLIPTFTKCWLSGRDPDPGDATGTARTVALAQIELVRGDPKLALDSYRATITAGFEPGDPAEIHAWAGLAMAVDATEQTSAARALYDRPDLVRAVHMRLTNRGQTPDPVHLADWLGRWLEAG
jgi:HEXXH motif-containing protein